MLRRPSSFSLLVFAGMYFFFYLAAMPLMSDFDTPWHIAAGRLILSLGELPAHDSWSFTAGNQPWYLISWWWDMLLALIDQMAGQPGLFVFTVSFTALLATLLISNVRRRENIDSNVLLLILLLTALSLMEFATARPHLAGFLCILLFHRLLHESRTSERCGRLVWLPLLMLLWVNVHGGFLVGFTLLGAYALEALITRRKEWLKHLLMTSVACLLVLPVNPYGLDIVSAVASTLDSITTQYIVEWRSFAFGESIGISVWLLVFIASWWVGRRRVPLADAAISLFWFAATLWSSRHGAVFILVSAPALAIQLQALLERLESVRTHHPDPLRHMESKGKRFVIPAIVLMLISAGTVDTFKGESYRVDSESDPGKAIAWLHDNAKDKRILNDYDYGGRIVYETAGAFPIFVDGRAGTAYPESVLIDYIYFMTQEEGWQQAVERYRIDGIFIANTQRFAVAYAEGKHRDGWQEVYRDSAASIYFRK